MNEILVGDVLDRLRELPDESVQCVVTSPPYWGLRDYGVAGQIGLEESVGAWVGRMVEVFREVRRILRADGTLFLNLGDSYSATECGRIRANEIEAFFRLPMEVRRQVFIVWRRALGVSVPGDVRDLLSASVEEGTPREDEGPRQEVLRGAQGGVPHEDRRAEQETPHRDDRSARREVCVLRGDGTDVSLPGSHQGRWTEGVQEGGRNGGGVETSHPRRAVADEVPSPVLELQRRAWAIWSVPSLELDLSDIPREARGLFAVTLKPKDLVGQPWRVAFALQADGWWLRSEIVWAKPNPMPESVTDRPTKSHEQIFLLSKSERYYYDPNGESVPTETPLEWLLEAA